MKRIKSVKRIKRIKRKSSYIDEIGSGVDAVGVDGPQVGKDVEEKVWENVKFDDKRDEVGRAAKVAAIIYRKTAVGHPIERDDNPQGKMPANTGDEWIDIGNASFSDKRDEVGRAAKVNENQRIADIVKMHLGDDEEDLEEAQDEED